MRSSLPNLLPEEELARLGASPSERPPSPDARDEFDEEGWSDGRSPMGAPG